MSRQIPLINNQIYHVYNRGVRKSDIFLEDKDYRRWEKVLYWCLHYDYTYSSFRLRVKQAQQKGKNPQVILQEIDQRHRFHTSPAEILTYVHMPNHFHLILKQITDNGIATFMHRVSTAYSKYFNERYDLSGSLYQGPYQTILVKTDEQLIHLFRYIHLNPLAAGLATKQNLLEYQWSSFPSFMKGYQNKLLTKKHLLSYFNDPNELYQFTLAHFEGKEADIVENLTLDDDFGWYREKRRAKKERINKTRRKYI